MKSLTYSRYDWLLQILVLPIYIGLLNWIMIGEAYWQNSVTFLLATGIAFVEGFINWLINNQVAFWTNRTYSAHSMYFKRAIVRYIGTSITSSINVSLLFSVYWLINLPGFDAIPIRLFFSILYTIVIVALVVITYEGIESYEYWQQSRREVDTLSKAQLQAQLDALRQQVNPHFLFNSLNSLISLIDENPKQAGAYAEELSSVYRYLLRSNETTLVSLANELEFIHSYYHLLKTRHGDAIRLVTDIVPDAEQRQLPPLTLQLLVENAVKHNVVLPDQPLTIVLTTDAHLRLTVSNNLQRKPSRALSNGVGLSNILTKYQMLGQAAPIIEEDGQEFRVTLPLI